MLLDSFVIIVLVRMEMQTTRRNVSEQTCYSKRFDFISDLLQTGKFKLIVILSDEGGMVDDVQPCKSGEQPTLHEILMAEKLDFEAKVQRAARRKKWLKGSFLLPVLIRLNIHIVVIYSW